MRNRISKALPEAEVVLTPEVLTGAESSRADSEPSDPRALDLRRTGEVLRARFSPPSIPLNPAAMIPFYLDELAERLAPKIADRIADRIQAPKVAPRWVDLDGAAILMSTTKDGVRGMARAKLFPIHKMGSRVMIDIRDLEKAFAENTGWLN